MSLIKLQNASFAYPGGHLANENLSLVVGEGERIAIVGRNGAGKTTCVKMMNGLYKPTAGDVTVMGENTKDKTTAQIARHVGYVFQNPDDQIFNGSVRAELEFLPRYLRLDEEEIRARVDRAAELCGLAKYLEMNPYEAPYAIRKFVTVATVMIANPRVVVLDEPTAGQDKTGMEMLANLIAVLQNEGKSIIAITHDMEFAVNNFTRAVVMAHKHILADGDVRTVFSKDDILAEARIKRPQVGILAERLGLPPSLNAEEFVEKFLAVKGACQSW